MLEGDVIHFKLCLFRADFADPALLDAHATAEHQRANRKVRAGFDAPAIANRLLAILR